MRKEHIDLMQTTFVKNLTGTAIVVGMSLSTLSFNSSSMVNPIDANSLFHYDFHADTSHYSPSLDLKRDNWNIYVISHTKLDRESSLIFGKMREATKEEQLSVHNYVRDISIKTGVNFFDLC